MDMLSSIHEKFLSIFGEGGTKDENQAVKWLRKAANQNDEEAQYFLGECYAVAENTGG